MCVYVYVCVSVRACAQEGPDLRHPAGSHSQGATLRAAAARLPPGAPHAHGPVAGHAHDAGLDLAAGGADMRARAAREAEVGGCRLMLR